MPLIGLGTFQLKGDIARQAVFEALQEGYRLVDTATIYRNEESVGEGLREAEKLLGIRRDEVFLTSKISPRCELPESSTPPSPIHQTCKLPQR